MNDKELLATKIEGNYKSPLKNCSCYNQKLEQLQCNWNSLFEYAKQQLEKAFDKVEQDTWEEVLEYMNELEGKDK